jgi:dTDP-4-amino-4,6-dideoxygalactose transaminase
MVASMPTEKFIPFARPTISRAEINEVAACLRSGWLATGPRSAKFEEMLREYFGAPHALCCVSATMGLWMALKAIDLKPGDEVITSPMTFVATLNTIVLAGGKPVLADVEPGTYNLDAKKTAAAITKRTRAIMPVHFAGCPVDLDAIYALARKHKLRVIEDCAHAIGAVYKGRRLGSFGDVQVFSFHPNKNMTTGEGGCVVTRDAKLARRVELLRFHGIDRAGGKHHSKIEGIGHFDVLEAGLKSNFMDLQAALGIHQLPALEGFNQKRRALAARYAEKLRGVPGLTLPSAPKYAHVNAWHMFAPVVERGAAVDRDTLIAELKKRQIGAGLHYVACHLHTFYQKTYGWRRGDFPEAERISDGILDLPLFPLLTRRDQDRVIRAMREILGLQSNIQHRTSNIQLPIERPR